MVLLLGLLRVSWCVAFLAWDEVGRGVTWREEERQNVLALYMHSPSACQREEESLGYDFCKRVGNGFGAPFFHFHSGGESADFEGVGTGEGVGGLEGHGLEDRLLQGSGGGVHGFGTGDVGECGFLRSIQGVEFGRELFRRERCCIFGGGLGIGFGQSHILISIACQFPCSESKRREDCGALLNRVVAIEVCS